MAAPRKTRGSVFVQGNEPPWASASLSVCCLADTPSAWGRALSWDPLAVLGSTASGVYPRGGLFSCFTRCSVNGILLGLGMERRLWDRLWGLTAWLSSWLQFFLSLRTWAGHLIALKLCFVVYKMGMVMSQWDSADKGPGTSRCSVWVIQRRG